MGRRHWSIARPPTGEPALSDGDGSRGTVPARTSFRGYVDWFPLCSDDFTSYRTPHTHTQALVFTNTKPLLRTHRSTFTGAPAHVRFTARTVLFRTAVLRVRPSPPTHPHQHWPQLRGTVALVRSFRRNHHSRCLSSVFGNSPCCMQRTFVSCVL